MEHQRLLGNKITDAPRMSPVSFGCNSTAGLLECTAYPTVPAVAEVAPVGGAPVHVQHKHAQCPRPPHMLAAAMAADP